MQRPVLVTGFGAFRDIERNPTAELARTVNGTVVEGAMVVGHVLPVTYAEGPDRAVRLARALDAQLVLGFGVASTRDRVMVERVGVRFCGSSPDTAGQTPSELGPGPDRVAATVDPQHLAELLGATCSEDAGGYVCNAWAWTVPQHLDVPAAFVHVPPAGVDPQRVLQAIGALIRRTSQTST